MWFVLSIFGGLLFAINKLIFRKVFAGNVNPITFFSIHDLLAGLILLPLAAFYYSHPVSVIGWASLLFAVIFIFFADLFAALSLMSTEAGIYQIAVQVRNIIALVGGLLFFNEVLTSLKLASIILIFAGVLIAMKTKIKIHSDRGIVYALISGAAIAIAFLFVKRVTEEMKPEAIAPIGLIFSGLLGFLVITMQKKGFNASAVKVHVRPLVIAAIIFAVFELVIFEALSIGQASRVVPASQSSMVFTLIGGYIFLRERSDLKQKILGGLITAIGVSMLIV